MKTNVYDLNGEVVREVKLPDVFDTPVKEEVIRRAVLSEESKTYQPKGNYRWAGMETSAHYVGRKEAYKTLKNRGQSRLPREFFGGGRPGRVRYIPSSVGGRRAHPPKPWKKIVELINKKEWLLALRSAISATKDALLVKLRGHRIKENAKLPIVVVDDFENISKTKEAISVLDRFIHDDLIRAKEGKMIRTGVRRRKGGSKYPKSALIVVSKDAPILKAARNIPGVDVVDVKNINVKLLAPGTHPGRLTIFTESALKELDNLWGDKE